MIRPLCRLLFAVLFAARLSAVDAAVDASVGTAGGNPTTPVAALAPRASSAAAAPLVASLPEIVGTLPVLHQGRVKPLAVAAEEIVYAITGTGRFAEVETVEDPHHPGSFHQEKTTKAEPTDLLMAMMLEPDAWRDRPLINASHLGLQRQLGFKGPWATLVEVEGAAGFLGAAVSKKQRAEATKEKIDLTPIEAEAYKLAERQQETIAALGGEAVAFMPLAPDASARAWVLATLAPAVAATNPERHEAAWRERLRDVQARPVESRDAALQQADVWLSFGDLRRHDPLLSDVGDSGLGAALAACDAWLAAVSDHSAADIQHLQPALAAALRAQGIRHRADAASGSAGYPSISRLGAEYTYHRTHPLRWAWVCYLLGGLGAAVGLRRAGASAAWNAIFVTGVALTGAGVVLNLVGLFTRFYITSLGIVTNLYETLLFVAFICAGLGLVFARATRTPLYAVAGGIAGALCAMVGDFIPPELGSQLRPLQPVLRDNFWLLTHVLCVVSSYGAFALAMMLGNIHLIRATIARRTVAREEGLAIYRCIQVGVLLVATGTLLGAWWADKAWGRFWGWDPKEIWALVTLLTYLIPLHLRYVGVVGPTGLAAWSVYGFMSVVMSWYGVNFLLGTGLHAYAFGSGGQGYVLTLCALQIVATTAMLARIAPAARAERERAKAARAGELDAALARADAADAAEAAVGAAPLPPTPSPEH